MSITLINCFEHSMYEQINARIFTRTFSRHKKRKLSAERCALDIATPRIALCDLRLRLAMRSAIIGWMKEWKFRCCGVDAGCREERVITNRPQVHHVLSPCPWKCRAPLIYSSIPLLQEIFFTHDQWNQLGLFSCISDNKRKKKEKIASLFESLCMKMRSCF